MTAGALQLRVSEQDFRETGDGGYVLSIPSVALVLAVSQLRRERGTLFGELTVRCGLPGARTTRGNGLIAASEFNLSSLHSRQTHAKFLGSRTPGTGIDWLTVIEEFCQLVIEAERLGQPALRLDELPRPPVEEFLRVGDLLLPRSNPAILFGDGGTGKSYLALYVAGVLTTRGERVLYGDWECDADTHRGRLELLFGEAMPRVHYVRCERPLVGEVDRLRRLCAELGITYVIYDSVAFACDGPPESAEVAAGYFRAARSVVGGGLHLAHITKSEGGDQKPFGSAFWHNGARMTWVAQRIDAESNRTTLSLRLLNRKSNVGALLRPAGFRFTFGEGVTSVTPASPETLDLPPATVSAWRRMLDLLDDGPLPVKEIARRLGISTSAVDKAIARDPNSRFVKATGEDGIVRVALRQAS